MPHIQILASKSTEKYLQSFSAKGKEIQKGLEKEVREKETTFP